MLGFSLAKFLFTVAVVAAVWYGSKWLLRYGELQAKGRAQAQRTRGRQAPEAEVEAEDMAACPTCGNFVAAQRARSCGQDICPYPD